MWKPMILDVECIVCNKSLQKINHIPSEVSLKMRKISRRSRTPNWSLDEKQYLLELINERKEVIVTKNNNGPNHSEEKDVAWNEILRELTTKFGNKFSDSSIKKVKTQWQNMKRIAREEISQSGSDIHKCTRQSLEVCNILEMGQGHEILKKGDESNVTALDTNVEIKTESLDEDMLPASNEHVENINLFDQGQQEKATYSALNSTTSSTSDSMSYVIDEDSSERNIEISNSKKSVYAMTDVSLMDRFNINPLHSELQDFFKFSKTEKEIKLETLKEERQVVRAIREAAELNKIIAEQKLKHVLWMKKVETGMYSGEPGSGAGKGGGSGGAIREAGGAFGKMQAAREDEYFYKKQKEQISNMKGMIDQEIAFHKDQIKRHEDAIRRHLEQKGKLEQE